MIKVLWNNHDVEEAIWETEEQMKTKSRIKIGWNEKELCDELEGNVSFFYHDVANNIRSVSLFDLAIQLSSRYEEAVTSGIIMLDNSHL
ncbi:hypothetical protein E5676_scaffold2754G00210 [Cucumis melo var. makuwa]|uniref:Uncharacterized protein n=1 Tax=Cucumis melo var. makuwa TaxID=1194695 RepID=A0A5D3CU78_CUCMM|nr:hypothetical protein E6C27_scaffold115G00390 [Cucumis melo var. makuwa]TYK14970.1 hypothetical protein E5676_scaffold2754G00210 [Cucumis melo var. makuwa]